MKIVIKNILIKSWMLCHNGKIPRLIWCPVPISTTLYNIRPCESCQLNPTKKGFWNRVHQCSVEVILSEGEKAPFIIESTNFSTCYIMVALLTKKKKKRNKAAVTIIETKTIVEFVECDPTDFHVGTNYQTPSVITGEDQTNIQQICACWRTHSHFWGLNSHLDHKHHLVYAR